MPFSFRLVPLPIKEPRWIMPVRKINRKRAMQTLSTDVLVVGAGGAGLYAAIEAARRGAKILLLDRSLVGRGGATVMAQMTVAAAVGPDGTDHWRYHYADTIAAGRGLCDPALARLLCEEGVEVIREMDRWRVGWARHGH